MAAIRKTDVVQDPIAFRNGRDTPPVFRTGSAVQAASGAAASAAAALPTGARTVVIRCSQATYIAFGDDTVSAVADATAILFFAGPEIVPIPLDANDVPYTHFSVLRLATDGVVQIHKVI